MDKHLLISIDELWLKGRNRCRYFSRMRSQVRRLLHLHLGKDFQLAAHDQRLIAESPAGLPSALLDALARLPGIFCLIPCQKVDKTLAAASAAAVGLVGGNLGDRPLTFKIECQRADKTFATTSVEVNRLLGEQVLRAFGERVQVDIQHPELNLAIKILRPGIFVSSRKIMGVGGLPVGMSGHLVGLLSGGLDSPVASYIMAKRGCSQSLVFFHAWPFVGEEVVEKVLALGKALRPYLGEFDLHIVPFGKIQQIIAKAVRPDQRTLFFRRYMIESAGILAERIGALALLTGDSLGQVSSQTLENLCLIDQVSARPILRPLVGFNKSEIISLARKIGTHDISLWPQDDACSLLAAKHPVTRGEQSIWLKFARQTDLLGQLQEEMQKALDGAKIHHFSMESEKIHPFQDLTEDDKLVQLV